MTKRNNPNDDHIYWGREKPKVDDLPLFECKICGNEKKIMKLTEYGEAIIVPCPKCGKDAK